MAMASSQQSFLTNLPLTSTHHHYRHHHHGSNLKPHQHHHHLLSCRSSVEKHTQDSSGCSSTSSDEKMRLVRRLAVVTLAAGVLALGSVDGAMAAKSGGRIGGQAFRSAAPRASSPRINNSRSNIYINPPVAPPLIGGYGYGVPFYGGGWGWSPFSFFAPGPSVAVGVGVGGGFELFGAFLAITAVAAAIRRFTGPRDDEDDY